jgi:hypothetical protein
MRRRSRITCGRIEIGKRARKRARVAVAGTVLPDQSMTLHGLIESIIAEQRGVGRERVRVTGVNGDTFRVRADYEYVLVTLR